MADLELAPGIAAFVAESERFYPVDAAAASIAEQRAYYRALCQAMARLRPPEVAVRDESLGGRLVRVYRPPGEGAQPAVLYLHGGGFVVGDLDSHDDVVAEIAVLARATAISVDYRLAPEHRFPAAFDDAYAALEGLAAAADRFEIDARRLAVCGDSAGGNLSAALALAARDRGGPALKGQVLIYPGLGVDRTLPSYRQCAEAPMLTTADVDYYWKIYGGDASEGPSPYAAPLLAEDFARLPPALVVTAEVDPLRDDGRLYVERLRAAGVPAELYEGKGLVHGFLRARTTSPAAARAFTRVCDGLAALLAGYVAD